MIMKYILSILKLLLLSFILLTSGIIFAQEEEIIEEEVSSYANASADREEEVSSYPNASADREVISLTELAQIMRSDEREVIISDYEIVSSDQDREFLVDKVFFSLYQIYPADAPAKKLYFYNCKFNLDDNAPLVLKGWEIIRLNLIGCEFLSPIGFEDFRHAGRYPFLIENCIFHDEIWFTNEVFELGSLIFKNNEFEENLLIDVRLGKLVVDKCKFIADSAKFVSRDDEKTYYQFTVGEKPVENIELTSNIFDNKGISNVFSVNFEAAEIGELTMISNHLQTLNLSSAEVEKALLIDSLFVDDYIGILNFDFPEANTNVSWYNLSGEKFSIFYTEESDLVIPYQAKSDKQLATNLKYNDLISAYSKFNTLYHDRGDISSANSSYVEIKNIETRKQAFVQKVNPSFNNLINYKLNVFLSFFSDYATNPGKSLIQSLWVIMFFTVLFMFSFSRWDGMNYKYYLNQFDHFSDYIRLSEPITTIYAKKESVEDKDIKVLLENYLKKGKNIPRVLRLFGGPLHFLGKFRYDVIPNLIRFFNFQPKGWNGLNTFGEKTRAGFLILIISFTFILYVLIVKSLNSFILSLNNFVVIGFGSLPEDDEVFAMYLSIIEGIIGWFLLTIFTITLLSQVLQNV